jgi:ribonuclease R
MGDKITIKIVSANLAKRQLDYEWVITAAEKSAFGALPPVAEGQDAAPDHKKGGQHGSRGGGDRGTRKSGGQGQRSGGRKHAAPGGPGTDKRRKKKK